MPALLSRYVRDNTGTVLMHRLTNLGSYEIVKGALGGHPLGNDFEREVDPLALRLPERTWPSSGGTSPEDEERRTRDNGGAQDQMTPHQVLADFVAPLLRHSPNIWTTALYAWLLITGTVGFLVMAYDKSAAGYSGGRVRETTLWWMAFIGGAFGMTAAGLPPRSQEQQALFHGSCLGRCSRMVSAPPDGGRIPVVDLSSKSLLI
jgi:uncharacterized membrane protein YsdA (DUF1294 family)